MHRALHKTRSGCCGGILIDVRPGRGDDRTAVAVAGGADLFQIDEHPFLGGWPPAAAAVATAQLLPGRFAVFTAPPPPYRLPRVVTQVGEGRRGHPGPEVTRPACQRRIDAAQQVIERLVGFDCSAQRLELPFDRQHGLGARMNVDVASAGAPFAAALDVPPEEAPPLFDW